MFKRIKKFLSRREDFEDERLARIFGARLRDNRLWTLNRTGVATGAAIGLFCAYLPMPMQMLPATIGAIAVRGNLPVALVMVWVSNPLTWVPLYTPAFHIGRRILGLQNSDMGNLRLDQLGDAFNGDSLRQLIEFLASLWVGCLVFGAILGTLAYFIVLYSWRLHVISRWRQRRELRKRANRIQQHRNNSQSDAQVTDQPDPAPSRMHPPGDQESK